MRKFGLLNLESFLRFKGFIFIDSDFMTTNEMKANIKRW